MNTIFIVSAIVISLPVAVVLMLILEFYDEFDDEL